MILRVVIGRMAAGQLEAVTESFGRDYAPVAQQAAGLGRYVVAIRPVDGGHELAGMTIWSTVEAALAAYGGDLASVRTLDGRAHGEELLGVAYYEIDDGGARRQPGDARHLRLTAGTVARGLDADIQQTLRLRMHELPPEALEAYVGRRVLDGNVEIAFMSTWSVAPAGRRLDEPLWPEISDRYDAFRTAVYEIIVDGHGLD